MTKLWTSIGLVAVVLVAAVVAQTGAGHSLMREIGVTRTPPGYTQLSFAHPQALPSRFTSPASLTVPFAIHNSTGAEHTYQWSIALVHGQNTDRLASGGTRVPAGGVVTTAPAVTVSCTGSGRVRLDVGLVSPRESIDFYATCTPPAGANTTGGTS
ncbi:MAG TPA: hypothetical protein VHY58_20170 [Streptosporangiaceae bacterium]|jgi:hypothetical protein|nr:hypothetical protein [Streptosporangiaceae bacterium]